MPPGYLRGELIRPKGVSFSDTTYGETLLLCPHCNGDYLHQVTTNVFERAEDADDGLHVAITGERAVITRDLVGNPSGRRHGLTIKFYCEECGKHPSLAILQHKGQTFVEWDGGDSRAA